MPIKRYEYVIWAMEIADPTTPEREFLRETDGDWGPSHMPTTRIEEAMHFPTREAADRYYREHKSGLGWKVRYVRIEHVTSYKYE